MDHGEPRPRQAGGLLQAVGGEEHLLGEGPELRRGPLAQALLRQRRRHQGGEWPSSRRSDPGQGLGGRRGQEDRSSQPLGVSRSATWFGHHPESFHVEPASGRDVHCGVEGSERAEDSVGQPGG